MGEGNWRLARPDYPVELRADPFDLVPLRQDPVSLCFTQRPGKATLLSLTTGEGGRLCFISTEGEIVDEPPIPRLNVIHAKFRPRQPLRPFLESWSRAGGSHHQAMAYGSLTGAVSKLAQILHIDHATV
jgi:L-arabinose isomerase